MFLKLSALICTLLLLSNAVAQEEVNPHAAKDCIDGPSTWYRGTHNITEKGTTCQRWDSDYPHKPKYTPPDGPEHNYCRNPDGDLHGTWCYTVKNESRWEYCEIPKCPDDSQVIWTNYDSDTETAHILSVKADPEIVKKQTDLSGMFNTSIIHFTTNKSNSEFWAVTGDYSRHTLFYTDYRLEYLGVKDLLHNRTSRKLEGIAHGIENLAYDYKTQNLYWTDSVFSWIMCAEHSFQYYTPVYKSEEDPLYALALHAEQRYLFFSSYKALGSKIYRTDLAGKNLTVLLAFPEVFDVTGMTVDYTDDRLYWTDFTGFGGMIVSSRLDGSNKTQHTYRTGSIFWGVAAYLDYLYVTDVHARFNSQSEKYYSVWVSQKHTQQVFRYTLKGKPRGITVLSKNEQKSFDTISPVGECSVGAPCDHICLPRRGEERQCACALGYHLVGHTQCKPKLSKDGYILIADSGQGHVYQIPLDSKDKSFYSMVPIEGGERALSLGVDVTSGFMYWSNKKDFEIYKSITDGSKKEKISKGKPAATLEVDPQNQNIFFVDDQTKDIVVMDKSGRYQKVIMTNPISEPNTTKSTNIKKLSIDARYKHIYWTDTQSLAGSGQVIRMKMDGTGREVVFSNLQWPYAITVDQKRQSLFFAEEKTAVIYEVPLLDIQTISTTDIKAVKSVKTYDLTGHLNRIQTLINDIEVHEDMLYLVDGKTNYIERFNMTAGVQSVKEFGPAEFFKITSLAIYDIGYANKYISPLQNPCSQSPCDQICIAKSNTEHQCLCESGSTWASTRGTCVSDPSAIINQAPKATNCPREINARLPHCKSTVFVEWKIPTWTDDNTDVADLVVVGPGFAPPVQLSMGIHQMKYIAHDHEGAKAECVFPVIISQAPSCGSIPVLPNYMERVPSNCNLFQSHTFKCKDADRKLFKPEQPEGSQYVATETNLCLLDGAQWSHPDPSSIKCVKMCGNQPCAAPTPAATNPPTTTKKVETPAKPEPAGKGTDAPPATAAPVQQPDNPAPSGQSGGDYTLPIVISLVVILIIIIVVMIVVTLRNRPIWKTLSVPVFWRRKEEEDDGQRMEETSTSPYSMIT